MLMGLFSGAPATRFQSKPRGKDQAEDCGGLADI